ncbi:MAG: hypothetical protein GC164_08355 [Phycisphaera sp.]|nr:hypothetical protein [Phycisphaera sp.]
MAEDQTTYRRGAWAALVGLGVQLALSIAILLTGLWARSLPMQAAAWYVFGGLPVWLVLLMLFYQKRIERAESLEFEQLSGRDTQAATIFDEHAADLQVARNRVRRIEKWGLGIVSAALSVYLLAVGLSLFTINLRKITVVEVATQLKSSDPESPAGVIRTTEAISPEQLSKLVLGPTASPIGMMFLCLGIAFAAFVVARYLSGMTRIHALQQLRGGAGYLMGNALVTLLLAIAALSPKIEWGHPYALAYLSLVIPGFMTLLGAEVLFTLLLSVYRPRRPGEIVRPAFDSRLLGLLTSPESLAKTVNEAINYQFGFEVSRSWFYQLLSRSITPLTIIGLVVLVLISSIVIVPPQDQAIVTRLGIIVPYNKAMNQVAYPPGLHLKWPWPIGGVMSRPVNQIQEIEFGTAKGHVDENVAMLWTNPHGQGMEDFFTVPAPPDTQVQQVSANLDQPTPTPTDTPSPLVNPNQAQHAPGAFLLGVKVVVQYRIKDLARYLMSSADPDKQLLALSEVQVNHYLVTKDIDELLGNGRLTAGDVLRGKIQSAVDADALGIEIVYVNLLGAHPPQDQQVAESFLKVIGALQTSASLVDEAHRKRAETLSSVAGSEEMATRIVDADKVYETLRSGQDTGAIKEQETKIESLIAQAGGESAQIVYDAISYRWDTSVQASSEASRFKAELKSYRYAPEYYKARRYYRVLSEGMADARKFVIDPRAKVPATIRIDLKDVESGLDFIKRQDQ